MGKLKSEYPTDGQMKEMWEALESGDDRAILAVLHKRQEEASSARNSTDKAEGEWAGPQNVDGCTRKFIQMKRRPWKS